MENVQKNKLSNFFDTASIAGLEKDLNQIFVGDSAGGNLLQSQLRTIDPQVLTQQYPDFTFVNSGIIFNNVGGYTSHIVSLKTTPKGELTLASDKASGKGNVSLSREAQDIKVYEFGAFSNWSQSEVERFKLSKDNYVNRVFEAHRMKYMQKVDEIGYIGVGENKGLLSYDNFATSALPDKLENLDSTSAFQEVRNLILKQWQEVKNIKSYMANVVVMPTSVYNVLMSKMLNTTNSSNITVLALLQQTFPMVKFMTSNRCEDVGGSSIMVAFSANRESMQFRLPMPLQFSPITRKGFGFEVETMTMIAGLDVLHDGSAMSLTGV